jgi:hypothetical protein
MWVGLIYIIAFSYSIERITYIEYIHRIHIIHRICLVTLHTLYTLYTFSEHLFEVEYSKIYVRHDLSDRCVLHLTTVCVRMCHFICRHLAGVGGGPAPILAHNGLCVLCMLCILLLCMLRCVCYMCVICYMLYLLLGICTYTYTYTYTYTHYLRVIIHLGTPQ